MATPQGDGWSSAFLKPGQTAKAYVSALVAAVLVAVLPQLVGGEALDLASLGSAALAAVVTYLTAYSVSNSPTPARVAPPVKPE